MGSKILNRFQELGRSVIGTSRKGINGNYPCDLRNSKKVSELLFNKNIKTIIHCAANTPRQYNDYFDEITAKESYSILKSIIKPSVEHIIFTSSMTVYSKKDLIPVRDDLIPVNPNETPYSAWKWRAERLLMNNNKRTTILRLPGIFGQPRETGLIYNAIKSFISGSKLSLMDNLPLWAPLHIDDAAAACIAATERKSKCSITLNVGYPGKHSIPIIVNKIAEMTGYKEKILHNCTVFEMDLSNFYQHLGSIKLGLLEERLESYINWIKNK